MDQDGDRDLPAAPPPTGDERPAADPRPDPERALIRTAGERLTRQQTTAETRARVVRSARAAFAAQGYTGASIRRIATDAGLTAMAIYTYAPSKADLFALVYEESIRTIYDTFAVVVADKETLLDEVEAIFECGGEILRQDPDLLRFTMRVAVDRGHPDLTDLDLFTEPYARFFQDLAERAIARGDIEPTEGFRAVAFVTMLLWGITTVTSLEPAHVQTAVDTATWAARGRLGSGDQRPS